MPLLQSTRTTTTTAVNAPTTRAGTATTAAARRPTRNAMDTSSPARGATHHYMQRRSARTPALDDERIRQENIALRQRLLEAKPRARGAVNAGGNTAGNTAGNANNNVNNNNATRTADAPANAPTPRRANAPTSAAQATTQARVVRRQRAPSPAPVRANVNATQSRRQEPSARASTPAATATQPRSRAAVGGGDQLTASPTGAPRRRRQLAPSLNDPKIKQANLEMRKRIREAKATAKSRAGCYNAPPTNAQMPPTASDSRRSSESGVGSDMSGAITAPSTDSDVSSESLADASHAETGTAVSTSSRLTPLEASASIEIPPRVETLETLAAATADDVSTDIHEEQEQERLSVTDAPEDAELSSLPHHEHTRSLTLDDIRVAATPFAQGSFGAVFLAHVDSSITRFRSIMGHDEIVNEDPNKPTKMVLKVVKLHNKLSKSSGEASDSSDGGLMDPGLAEKAALLAIPQHPGIIKIHAVFEEASTDMLYLLMERGYHGDLLDVRYKIDDCIFTEHDARFYAASIALSMQHMHALGYVHRDIKPDNIVIDEHGRPKLIDFGFTTRLAPGERSTAMCGTPSFCAPEILIARAEEAAEIKRRKRQRELGNENTSNGHKCQGFDRAVDLWAFGAMLYDMLVGITPFQSFHHDPYVARWMTMHHIKQYGKGANILQFPSYVSADARDLIRRLLARDPAKRLGMNGDAELRSHPWFRSIDWDSLLTQDAPSLDWMQDSKSKK